MRISATTLDTFRLYMDEDWMPERDLLASIRRERQATHEMALGTAFGQVLADPDAYRARGGYRCEVDGETFDFGDDVMGPALDAVGPRGVFEAKATGTYRGHTVATKADHVYGAELHEFKTTTSSFDIDKYLAAYQWRFMADIFRPARITYTVFCLFESAQNGTIELRGIERFTVAPYPGMRLECESLVRRFVDYVHFRRLGTYLDPSTWTRRSPVEAAPW